MTFGPFQIGCMKHFKIADGQVSPMQDARLSWFGFFNPLFIGIPVAGFSGNSPAIHFRRILIKAPVYNGFPRFKCLWGDPILSAFLSLFGTDFLRVDLTWSVR
jgi:hypothetical protein